MIIQKNAGTTLQKNRKMEICDNNTAVEGIKEKSRDLPTLNQSMGYVRLFHKNSVKFQTRITTEQEFLIFFRHLRTLKFMASLNMWTTYSMIKSTIKRKYGSSLKFFPQNN